MKLIRITLFVVFLFVLEVFPQEAKIGKSAPDFKLTDSYGVEHALSNYKGKVVVLEWINFGCPFVKKHYKSENLQKLQKKFTQKGIIWLAVCSSAKGKQGNLINEEIHAKTKFYNANYTAYLIDDDGLVGKLYGAKTTPHMFVIDSNGILQYAGGIDDKPSTKIKDLETARNYVDEALDSVLMGKEVKTKSSRPYGCSVKYK